MVNTFSATNKSEAIVPASREAIWSLLTDPQALVRMTPLLSRVDVDGEHWTWHLTRIAALGVQISPVFTEQMTFDAPNRIDYSHQPPEGVRERTGVDGHYRLSDVSGGTRLSIRLTIHTELPLPRATGPAVAGVIATMMARTGEKFAANLLRELGVEVA
ncbi:Carbon monoxide dehydrogenase subunit G [Frankineae bacterium MT45]|nr:Carbon monoxide dehydrogenase subunit G [Frankineae bacterium MT45]